MAGEICNAACPLNSTPCYPRFLQHVRGDRQTARKPTRDPPLLFPAHGGISPSDTLGTQKG
ncbi:hypothetical protein JOQ06_007223, partial [Pogonophryne albipinna]